MTIFNWMQNKLIGKQEKKISNSSPAFPHNARKEEFDDWPQTLLAIGTLGDDKMKEDASRKEPSTSSQASKDLPEFKSEEVDKLRKELTELQTRNQLKPSTDDESERGKEGRASLLLDTDGAACANIKENLSSGDDDDFEPSTDTKIILARVRDLLADNMISGSRKTSLKLLLKKMFACHGGFVPTPNIKDPLPESRMEKILRALLHKKIYPHGSAQPVMKRFMNRRSAVKRYLESKPAERLRAEETKEKGEDSNKWVKTDSEYIVLEI